MRLISTTCTLAALATAVLISTTPAVAATAEAGEKRGDLYTQEVGRQTSAAQRRNADMTRVRVDADETAQVLRVTATVVNLSAPGALHTEVRLTDERQRLHVFYRDLDTGDIVGVSQHDVAHNGYVCAEADFQTDTRQDAFTYLIPYSCLTRTDPDSLDEQGNPVETGRITRARVSVESAHTKTTRDGGFWAAAVDESKQTRMLTFGQANG